MARESKLKLQGKKLKEFMLREQIDKDAKEKIPIRVVANTSWKDIGGNTSPGNFRYWCIHDTIVNSEPYKGKVVDEELVYRYAIDNKIFTKIEVPFIEFTNNTILIREKRREQEILSILEERYLGISRGSDSLVENEYREETLRSIMGVSKSNLDKLKKDVEKQLG